MTGRNTYATLAEFKAFLTSRGQTSSTDTTDDAVIDGIMEACSRYIDDQTTRFFYPRIETRSYSIPDWDYLSFDSDLLEVVSVLNGDDSSVSSTVYNLLPKNEYPKYGLQIKSGQSIIWLSNSDGESEYVIDVNAVFGFHNRYGDAWKSVGTLGAAITDTTTLAFTMTAGHTLAVGKIAKIDSELYIINTVSSNTITPLKRGDNGSTAATHLNGATVYTYEPMESLRNSVLEMTQRAYRRRFGQSQGNDSTVTASGFILPPKDVPAIAKEFIVKYQRIV